MKGGVLPDLPALADAMDRLGAVGRVTLVCYLAVAIAVVLDLVVTAPHRDRLGRGRATCLAITISIALAAAAPFAWLVAELWHRVAPLSPPALSELWMAHPVAGIVACFVTVDAVAYLYHWVGHRSRVGWASHRVHHLAESFDMTLVLRQPWFPIHGLAIVPLTALGGFSFEAVAACSMISIAYQALQHTSRSWGLGPLEALLMSGRAHRHHHVIGGSARNLGAVLSVWDRALGTWQSGPVEPDARYGTGRPEPLNALVLQLGGWRAPGPRPDAQLRSGHAPHHEANARP